MRSMIADLLSFLFWRVNEAILNLSGNFVEPLFSALSPLTILPNLGL